MENGNKICKCGNSECLGFILLHEKELTDLSNIKENTIKKYGNVTFELRISPSSGEIFQKFYELHATANKNSSISNMILKEYYDYDLQNIDSSKTYMDIIHNIPEVSIINRNGIFYAKAGKTYERELRYVSRNLTLKFNK